MMNPADINVFAVAEGGRSLILSFILIGLLTIIPMLLLCWLAYSVTHSSVKLLESGIAVKAIFYGRQVPYASIVIDETKMVDLRERPEYTPAIRINGVGLWRVQLGWFRLKSGEKALVILTDISRAVYIKTREGYAVLVSLSDPETFINELRLRQI
jgi:hypothetical protein